MNNNYEEVLTRIRFATGLPSATKIAENMECTPQALSNYKKKGLMPLGITLKIANIYGISFDWLLSGEGNVFRTNDCRERGTRDFMPQLDGSACVEEDN